MQWSFLSRWLLHRFRDKNLSGKRETLKSPVDSNIMRATEQEMLGVDGMQGQGQVFVTHN